MTDGEKDCPLAPVEEHATTIRKIADSDAPDAHVHRVLLALANGEDPKEEDVKEILDRN
jgi:hypothetical protein